MQRCRDRRGLQVLGRCRPTTLRWRCRRARVPSARPHFALFTIAQPALLLLPQHGPPDHHRYVERLPTLHLTDLERDRRHRHSGLASAPRRAHAPVHHQNHRPLSPPSPTTRRPDPSVPKADRDRARRLPRVPARAPRSARRRRRLSLGPRHLGERDEGGRV